MMECIRYHVSTNVICPAKLDTCGAIERREDSIGINYYSHQGKA